MHVFQHVYRSSSWHPFSRFTCTLWLSIYFDTSALNVLTSSQLYAEPECKAIAPADISADFLVLLSLELYQYKKSGFLVSVIQYSSRVETDYGYL